MNQFPGRFLLLAAFVATLLSSPALADPVMGINDTAAIRLGPAAVACDATMEGSVRYDDASNSLQLCDDLSWITVGAGAGSLLSSITAATGANSINSGANAQTWNWALTGATADAFTFTENTAATGGSGDQSILKAAAIASSTAIPLMVTNLGNGLSFRVNDETGDADTTPFVVDASGNVGIGTAMPNSNLEITATTGTAPDAVLTSYGVNATGIASFVGRAARGSQGSEAAVQTDDRLVSFRAHGHDGTGWAAGAAAAIEMNAAQTWSGSAHGSYMIFQTTPTGSTTRAERMRIAPSGNVGISTTNPQSALHVPDGKYAQFEDNNAGAPPAGDCDADAERGRLSIDTTNNRLYVCNGATRGWEYIAFGTGNPTFVFTDVGGTPTLSVVTSNTIIPTGFGGSQTISISGAGSPEYSVAGGAWTSSSSTITAGQSLQVRLTSSSTGNTQRAATVTIAGTGSTWTVTTATKIVIYENGSLVDGDFGNPSGGGRAGADAYCQSVIPAGLVCNATVRAFVSLDSSDTVANMPTNYGFASGVPLYWYNRGTSTANILLGNSWADMLDGSIQNSAATGTGISSGNSTWTGSDAAGNLSNTCTGWTSNSAGVNGAYGAAANVSGTWLSNGTTGACNGTARVYCVCVQN